MRTYHNAWIICADDKTIRPVQIEMDGLKSYYTLLETTIVEIGGYLPNGDMVIVDEEGLLTMGEPRKAHWFLLKNVNAQPLVKRAIIVGDAGEVWTDPKSTLDQVRSIVEWLTPDEAERIFANPPPLHIPEGIDNVIDCRFNPFEERRL